MQPGCDVEGEFPAVAPGKTAIGEAAVQGEFQIDNGAISISACAGTAELGEPVDFVPDERPTAAEDPDALAEEGIRLVKEVEVYPHLLFHLRRKDG